MMSCRSNRRRRRLESLQSTLQIRERGKERKGKEEKRGKKAIISQLAVVNLISRRGCVQTKKKQLEQLEQLATFLPT